MSFNNLVNENGVDIESNNSKITNTKINKYSTIFLKRISVFFKLTVAYLVYVYLYIMHDANLFAAFLLIGLIVLSIYFLWDKTNKMVSIFSILMFFSILITTILMFKTKNHVYVYKKTSNYQRIFHNFLPVNETQKQDFNIFFIETNSTRHELSMKELCSLESAALNNPKSNIYLYSSSIPPENLTYKDSIVSKSYSNIKILKLIPEEIFSQTPHLLQWWNRKKQDLLGGPYSIQDLSDSARLALLWKYGGIYSDLDTITIRSFEDLLSYDGLGYITEFEKKMIANGVLHFSRGHKLIEEAMNDLSNSYDPSFWGFNGPLLFIRSIKKYCNLDDNFYSLLNYLNQEKRDVCKDVNIFPENFFYPISWEQVNKLYEANSSIDIRQFKESYSVHFYGKFSNEIPVYLGQNSIYEFFAARHCPKTYEFLKLYNPMHF